MNIGEAVEALRAGKRVQRAGWNGKGMWLELWKPEPDGKLPGRVTSPDSTEVFSVDPAVAMKTAGGTYQPGWLCSQADLLAEDWSTL